MAQFFRVLFFVKARWEVEVKVVHINILYSMRLEEGSCQILVKWLGFTIAHVQLYETRGAKLSGKTRFIFYSYYSHSL